MINHARTLLLNTNPQNNQRQDAGYEYIPDTFRPQLLPQTLTTIHKVLFGTKPDTYFLNLRARELLTYIHQTELAEYIYKLDPRVTYWPTTNAPFFENAKPTITVTQVAGNTIPLSIGGTFVASDSTGATTKQFEITATSNSGVVISIQDINSLTSPTIVTVADPARPQAIALPETKLQIQFDMTAVAEVPVQWRVSARANPQPAITSLLPILEILGEPLFLDLFGVAPVEPYATFKNLWFDHPLAAYRLSGLVLAFIYRAEELRKVNDG